ncbi:MAG: hypothetical protein EOO93_15125 [Pedobacter sp.]|nr:MAG: hypothetical protein EOO93_15125 [Pedobacter sp.]
MNLFLSLINLYRTNGLKTPLEDFTTEIFVNILINNEEVRRRFIKDILKIDGDGFTVSSQENFHFNKNGRTYCKIDIVFRNENSICFLENKVHSNEGFGQLTNYADLLDELNQYENTYLRFCTKFYQDKAHITKHNFMQFRWCNVANFLSAWKEQELINTFLEFLEINQMGNSTDFTLQEVLALENFNTALLKMDAYLDKLKPKFTSMFGDIKMAKNMSQIREHTRHVFWKEYLFGEYYSELGVGFKFTTYPHLTVWIWTGEENPRLGEFKKLLEGVNEGFHNGSNYLELLKPLSDFVSSDSMEVEIEAWFMQAFTKIKKLADLHPELNWHIK